MSRPGVALALLLGLTALVAGVSAQDRSPLTREQALADMKKPDLETRRRATAWLGEVGVLADAPVLIGALTDADEVVRTLAEHSVWQVWGRSGDAEADGLLRSTGVPAERIHFVGNPMIDTLLAHRSAFESTAERDRLGLAEMYGVVTLHRPSNVDGSDSARAVVDALDGLAELVPLVLPLHPRGRSTLESAGLRDRERLRVIEPLGYLAFLSLVAGARLVLTDSGGIQEETTILDVPCLTMRPNTERPITISHGTNRLVAPADVVAAAAEILDGPARPTGPRPPLWDGHAGERIADAIVDWLGVRARTASV